MNEVITGFTGADSLTFTNMGYPAHGAENGNTFQILSPTATSPLHGSTIAFGGTANTTQAFVVVNVGNVGTGTAAEVAAAANQVYIVADVNGTTANPYGGEEIVFMGQAGANTVMEVWAAEFTNGTPHPGADTQNAHTVTAAEFTQSVTLVGVQVSSITATNFY
jgi:hypothetical protein